MHVSEYTDCPWESWHCTWPEFQAISDSVDESGPSVIQFVANNLGDIFPIDGTLNVSWLNVKVNRGNHVKTLIVLWI